MKNFIVYEQPLNERVRSLLRVEHLFALASQTIRGASTGESRHALNIMNDILEIITRSDFKSELIAGIKYVHKNLTALRYAEGVNNSYLESLLARLQHAEEELFQIKGSLGKELRHYDVFTSLRARRNVPGGDCPIDSPLLHYWLEQPPEQRKNELDNWLHKLDIVQRPVALILELFRDATEAQVEIAADGVYQQQLDATLPYQLIRVGIPANLPCYAEISASRHSINIRFLQPQRNDKAFLLRQDITFELTCCAL